MVLGVIPARGGSKGIPDKNLYPLKGKPLIQYSIEEAQKAKSLTKLIVSTDSEKIAKVARSCGAEVPFMRPAELATDTALAVDVMKHALQTMEKLDKVRYDYLVMLQPTTPFRLAKDIDEAIKKLIETGCNTVVSVVDVGAYHPARMYQIKKDLLERIMEEGVPMRPRQELPPVYIRSGDVYACQREVLFKKNSLMGDDCRPIIIPMMRAINIDGHNELILAEHYLQSK